MKQRGRPPTPSLLTPREEQVLALIREGRSNREIATALGISLQGVKYHVTEILGKLDVRSREEAAAYETGSARRWGFAPFSVLGSWVETAATVVTPKLAVASLAIAALTGGMLLLNGDRQSGEANGPAHSVAPTPTPDVGEACRQTTTVCMIHASVLTEVTTLAEASAIASFVPVLPPYIPPGFHSRTIVHSRPGVTTQYYPDGRSEEVDSPFKDPHYDKVATTYRQADEGYLTVMQGYYDVVPGVWWELAPEDLRGTAVVGGVEVRWMQGGPKPGARLASRADGSEYFVHEDWDSDDSHYTVYWTMGSVATGTWEAMPGEAPRALNRPLEYLLSSDMLPLEELLKIAASLLE